MRSIPIILLTFLVILLLTSLSFPFETWIPIDNEPPGTNPTIEIVSHCDDYTIVRVTIHGFWCEDVYEEGETFQKIWVPVYGTKMEIGKPELPVVRGLMGYPPTMNSSDIEVVSATWEDFYDYLIYPHQPDYPLQGPIPPFEWD